MPKPLSHRIKSDMAAITELGQPELDPTKLHTHATHKHRVEQSKRGTQGAGRGQARRLYRRLGTPGRPQNGEVV